MSAFGLIGAAAIGSAIQAFGASQINSANIKYQDEANRLSQDLANTAHQREVADLRAAGLNPILSAGGSGASTPQLGTPDLLNPAEGIGNSAAAVGRELAHYMSDQYQLGVQSARSALRLQQSEDSYERLLVNQQKKAIERWLNPTSSWTDKKGNVHVTPDWSLGSERQEKIDKWLVDAYISDIKLRGNANWQRNLGAFLGVLNGAAGAVNSAAGAAGTYNQFRRTGLEANRLRLESSRQYDDGTSVYRHHYR